MNDTQNFGPENNSPVTQKRDPKESIKMPASWEIYEARQGGILPRRTPFDRKFLAVLVPHTGEVPAEFSHRLAYLRMPPNSEIFMSKEIPLDVSRENMARRALDAGFEWLFFLDSDVLPPENVFEELFSVKQPIVTGIYRTKKKGNGWSIWKEGKNTAGQDTLDHVENWSEKIITCDTTGFGCILIHRQVFENFYLKFPTLPWFLWTMNRHPGFMQSIEVPDPHMRHVGEDFWFCLLARACGYKIYVNTDVKCTHIGTVKLTENEIVSWNQ